MVVSDAERKVDMHSHSSLAKVAHGKLAAVASSVLICFATIQFYSVRELLVAELLFVSVLLCLLLIGGTIYLLGAITQQGLHVIEAKAHRLAEVRVHWRKRV